MCVACGVVCSGFLCLPFPVIPVMAGRDQQCYSFNSRKKVIHCVVCNGVYHLSCVGLTRNQQRSSYGGLVSDAWDVQNLNNEQNRTLILLGTSLNVVLKGVFY